MNGIGTVCRTYRGKGALRCKGESSEEWKDRKKREANIHVALLSSHNNSTRKKKRKGFKVEQRILQTTAKARSTGF